MAISKDNVRLKARAGANFALIKYWGKANARLNVPAVGSISITLDSLFTETEVALAPQFHWMPGTEEQPSIGYGLLGRLGVRWAIVPSVIIDGSIGYQLEVANARPPSGATCTA